MKIPRCNKVIRDLRLAEQCDHVPDGRATAARAIGYLKEVTEEHP